MLAVPVPTAPAEDNALAPDSKGRVLVIVRTRAGRFAWVARANCTHHDASLPPWDASVDSAGTGINGFTARLTDASVVGGGGSGGGDGDGAGAAPRDAASDPLMRLVAACSGTLEQHTFADTVAGATTPAIAFDGTAVVEVGGGGITPAADTAAASAGVATTTGGGPAGGDDVHAPHHERVAVDTPPFSSPVAASFEGFEALLGVQAGEEQEQCDGGDDGTSGGVAGHGVAPLSSGLQPPTPPLPYADGHVVQSVRRLIGDVRTPLIVGKYVAMWLWLWLWLTNRGRLGCEQQLGGVAMVTHGMLRPLRASRALVEDLATLDACPCTLRHEVVVHYMSFDELEDGSEKLFICQGTCTVWVSVRGC